MSVSAIIAFNQWLKWMYQCADDVLMVSREECVVKYMLARTDAFLEWSGLEIKDKNVLFCMRGGVEGTDGTVQNLIKVQCLQ